MCIRIGVIAVGGKGSRLGNDYTQKCLVPLENKPVIEYTIEAFVDIGVKIIFFLTGFLHEQISSYLIQKYSTSLHFVPACVFGGVIGIAPALSTLHPFVNEPFIFAHGDSVIDKGIFHQLLENRIELSNYLAVVLVSQDVGVAPSHVCFQVRKHDFKIDSIKLAKPGRNLCLGDKVDTGVYLFNHQVFKYLRMIGPDCQLAEFMEPAIADGKNIYAIETKCPWYCLHTKEDARNWHKSSMRKYLHEEG